MKKKMTPQEIWDEWGWALTFSSKREFIKFFNKTQRKLRQMGLVED